MSLDSFDLEYTEQEGNAQEILHRLLGLNFGNNNARKYHTGIKHYLDFKKELGGDERQQYDDMEEVITRKDGSQTTRRMMILSDEEAKDPPRVMKLMGYDPIQWELISCKIRRNYWDVTIKNKAKVGVKHTNHAFACEVTAKPIQNVITTEYIKKVFSTLETPNIEEIKYHGGGKMLELPIMDLHLAKLSDAIETGEDYNLDIAVDLYKNTVLDLLGSIKELGIPIEKIIYPIGQDFFHVDNDKSETTKGTRVDTSSTWTKMYRAGTNLLIWTVEQLRSIAPVECMYVAGNHDKVLSYCATLTVDAKYSSIDSVTVDVSPQARKYIVYGKNLIGFSHGVEERKRIEHLMQTEMPEAWGKTKFREFHLGHLHSEHAKEMGGIIFRRIASITAPDKWHVDGGWDGAIRKAQAFIWDKNTGKWLTIDSNVITSSV